MHRRRTLKNRVNRAIPDIEHDIRYSLDGNSCLILHFHNQHRESTFTVRRNDREDSPIRTHALILALSIEQKKVLIHMNRSITQIPASAISIVFQDLLIDTTTSLQFASDIFCGHVALGVKRY